MTVSTPARRFELLERFFASATHDASAAMCRWTGGLVSLSFDQVREVRLEEAYVELELTDQPSTMVVLSLEGEIGVRLILIFDDRSARQLAAALLGREPQVGPWTKLEKSALLETGNILGCAYLNALVRLIDAEMVPSPPDFLQDYAASVLQQALLGPAAAADQLLICQTGFHCEGMQLDWRVVFIPTEPMRQAMQAAAADQRR